MTFTKQQKRFISRLLSKGEADPIAPLTVDSRYHYDAETETVSEYGLIRFEDWFEGEYGDLEISLWFEQHMWRRIPEHMYWDCTGQAFTIDISWHRNPCGLISFVHKYQYDY